MTARALSTTGNAVTGVVDAGFLSPVQVDHLIRGYFGWLGMFAVGFADLGARHAADQPQRPAIDVWKTATGGMLSQLEDAPSRYVSQVYEQTKAIDEAWSSYSLSGQSVGCDLSNMFQTVWRNWLVQVTLLSCHLLPLHHSSIL